MKAKLSCKIFLLLLTGAVVNVTHAGTGIPSNCRKVDGSIDWDCVCAWWCPDNGGAACNCDLNPLQVTNPVFQKKSQNELTKKLNGESIQKNKG